MRPPEINEDEDSHYFLCAPQHTCDLITYLRQHIEGFSVDVGGLTVDYKDDADSFECSKSTDKNVLAGLLATFFATRI